MLPRRSSTSAVNSSTTSSAGFNLLVSNTKGNGKIDKPKTSNVSHMSLIATLTHISR
jgi:hypothetical protein